jgi:hypothetical protein
MKKLSLLIIFAFILGAFRGNAQSLHNTAWKMYVAGLSDTLTLHIGSDTSFVTISNGEVVVRSVCHASGDTLTMKDFEGQYACQDGTGVYHYTVKDDKLVLKMVTDPCDNRVNAINGIPWDRAKMMKN